MDGQIVGVTDMRKEERTDGDSDRDRDRVRDRQPATDGQTDGLVGRNPNLPSYSPGSLNNVVS